MSNTLRSTSNTYLPRYVIICERRDHVREEDRFKFYLPVADDYLVTKLFQIHISDVIKVFLTLNDMYIELFCRILKENVNSYTFSKSLAESLVYEYVGRMPVIIVRPAVGTCFPTIQNYKFVIFEIFFSDSVLQRAVPRLVQQFAGPHGTVCSSRERSSQIHVYG